MQDSCCMKDEYVGWWYEGVNSFGDNVDAGIACRDISQVETQVLCVPSHCKFEYYDYPTFQ